MKEFPLLATWDEHTYWTGFIDSNVRDFIYFEKIKRQCGIKWKCTSSVFLNFHEFHAYVLLYERPWFVCV